MAWEKDLERWVDARLIDPLTAERIRDFENSSDKKRLRWPAILAISFGHAQWPAGGRGDEHRSGVQSVLKMCLPA